MPASILNRNDAVSVQNQCWHVMAYLQGHVLRMLSTDSVENKLVFFKVVDILDEVMKQVSHLQPFDSPSHKKNLRRRLRKRLQVIN